MNKLWQHALFLPVAAACCFVVLTLLSGKVPFFWDGVALVSKPALHFYQNGFYPPLLPIELDAGHPPLYALYLAFLWKLFGVTLPVTHWAALPFLAATAWACFNLARYLQIKALLLFAVALLFLEPCFATQSILGGSDIALVCCYLWSVESLLTGKTQRLWLLLPLLCMLSLRGILLLPGFAIGQYLLLQNQGINIASRLKTITVVLFPALLTTAAWFTYHYLHTGFITNNTIAAHWAANYGFASIEGILRNLAIVGWRMADQGRIVMFIAGIVLYRHLKTRGLALNTTQKRYFLILVVQFLAFLPFVVIRQNPIMHRYFMAFYLLCGLWVLALAEVAGYSVKRNLLLSAVFAAMFSGHWWIYPFPVANGWDATIACLPYFHARMEVNEFLEKNHILPDSVCTTFPMVAGTRYTRLEPENRFQFIAKDKMPVSKARYVLYSNLSNDFTPTEVLLLQQEFAPLQTFGTGMVTLVLYRRNP